MLHLKHDAGRWLGVILHPVLFWVLLGAGFMNSFRMGGVQSEDYLHYAFPGMLLMIIMFTGSFTAMSAITDRKEGLLMGLFAGPVRPVMLAYGKTLGIASIVLVQCLLVLPLAGFCGYTLSVAIILSVIAALSLWIVAFSAINTAIAWKLSSTYAYHGLMSIVWIPLWLSSGAMFPPDSPWMRIWVQINPFSHALFALRYALGAAPLAYMPSLTQAYTGLLTTTFISLTLLTWTTRRIPKRVQ